MKETVWDKYWQENRFDNKQIIKNLKSSYIWEDIRKIILDKFGSFNNLKTIELGSGRGEMSLLMALEGTDVTLVDESEFALKEAEKLYKEFDCKPRLIKKNVFNLKNEDYDIALSFGLVEHFKGEIRFDIINKHYNLIKKGGIIIISVPNANCFPYRIYKFVTTLTGFWKYGLEIPYSEKELDDIGKRLYIGDYKILGSSFFSSFYHFLIINPLKLMGIHLKERFSNIKMLDRYGFSLTFVGKK